MLLFLLSPSFWSYGMEVLHLSGLRRPMSLLRRALYRVSVAVVHVNSSKSLQLYRNTQLGTFGGGVKLLHMDFCSPSQSSGTSCLSPPLRNFFVSLPCFALRLCSPLHLSPPSLISWNLIPMRTRQLEESSNPAFWVSYLHWDQHDRPEQKG